MKYCCSTNSETDKSNNPFIGCRVIVRTFSAGVHIGTLVAANGKECELHDCLRLWSWSDGPLSLSAIATNGVNKARINKSPKIFLTEAIEYIPISSKADHSFKRWIEDNE